ncbi:MAG TPA: hypothetical protein VJ890_26005 [Vineibacter sp.]|nr:hypothetical protein [Vineibacter sp.]
MSLWRCGAVGIWWRVAIILACGLLAAAPRHGAVAQSDPRDEAAARFQQLVHSGYTQCGNAWYASADIVLPADAGAFARRAFKPRTIYVRLDDVSWSLEEVAASAADLGNGLRFRGHGIGAAATIIRKDVPWQSGADPVGDWKDVKPRHGVVRGRTVFLDQLYEQRDQMTSKRQFEVVFHIAWSDGADQYMQRRKPVCGEVPR